MLENEHLHFIEDRQGRFICIDISRADGHVFQIGYYSNSAPMISEVVNLLDRAESSLV